MAQISQWFANEIIQMAFHRDTYSPSWTQLEVAALLSEPPSETDPTLLNEPTSDPTYARQVIPFNTANWTLGELGEVTQANSVTFPVATVAWGPVTNYALIASSYTGGFSKMIAGIGYLAQQPRIAVGDQLQIAAGTIFFGLYDGH